MQFNNKEKCAEKHYGTDSQLLDFCLCFVISLLCDRAFSSNVRRGCEHTECEHIAPRGISLLPQSTLAKQKE